MFDIFGNDINEKKAEKDMLEKFERVLSKQAQRQKLLDEIIEAIGNENIKVIHINNHDMIYNKERKKWVSV